MSAAMKQRRVVNQMKLWRMIQEFLVEVMLSSLSFSCLSLPQIASLNPLSS